MFIEQGLQVFGDAIQEICNFWHQFVCNLFIIVFGLRK
jgi:hypothetical protein